MEELGLGAARAGGDGRWDGEGRWAGTRLRGKQQGQGLGNAPSQRQGGEGALQEGVRTPRHRGAQIPKLLPSGNTDSAEHPSSCWFLCLGGSLGQQWTTQTLQLLQEPGVPSDPRKTPQSPGAAPGSRETPLGGNSHPHTPRAVPKAARDVWGRHWGCPTAALPFAAPLEFPNSAPPRGKSRFSVFSKTPRHGGALLPPSVSVKILNINWIPVTLGKESY